MISQPEQRGFSIAELVTVLAIVAVTAAISIPAGLAYVRDYQAVEAARSVADNLAAARREAIQRNAPQGMMLSLDGPRQMTLVENRRPGVRDRLTPEGEPAEHFTLPEGYELVAANGQRAAFVFRSDGSIDAIWLGRGVANLIEIDGMNFVLKVRDRRSDAVSNILIGRSGQVVVR